MPTPSKFPTDKLDTVSFRGTKLRKADIMEVLFALPDMAPLNTSEASVMLGYSVSQMERMRIAGNGPRYRQSPPMPGSRGTNLAVTYIKGDLIAWSEENTATSAMKHAALHGRTFTTLQEVAEEIAFYVDETSAIESMVEENTVGTVIDRLGAWDIQWFSAADACGRAWSNIGSQRSLAGAVRETLQKSLGGVQSGLEASEIREAMREAGGAAPKPRARRDRPL
jgi:hypothetical protein